MRVRQLVLVLLGAWFLLCGWAAFGQTKTDNEELRQLYLEDQTDRNRLFAPERNAPTRRMWEELSRRDEERRKRIQAMVSQDRLHTAADYFHAAMVLQHGTDPEHYLLSHVLATVAGFKGHETGRWLSAASLDRYLQKIDRHQIFGTQRQRPDSTSDWTQEPYHRTLITDSLRTEFGVPPLAQQSAR